MLQLKETAPAATKVNLSPSTQLMSSSLCCIWRAILRALGKTDVGDVQWAQTLWLLLLSIILYQ
jgi:hypothetical protein